MSRWFVGVAVAGAVLAALPLSVARGAGSDDPENLIRQGIELRKAHDAEGAARAFQRAYDQVHTPRAAGQLGLAEQALGRWEDAERHVSEAVHATTDPWVAKNLTTLEDALGTIEAHLGRVEVLGGPEGAEVSVNGRTIGKLPLSEAVHVSAGEVDVELRAPGYVPAQRTLTIVGGQYQRLVLHLAKEGPAENQAKPASNPAPAGSLSASDAGPTTPIVVSPAPEGPSRARLVLKWSAAGLAAVGLAVGVIATLEHNSSVASFDARQPECADKSGTAVHVSDGSPAPECQGDLDDYRHDTTYAVAGFVGAGAFAVTWLILELTEGPTHSTAEHALARPLCVPSLSGVGVACELRF
jgi:hypothetical protein